MNHFLYRHILLPTFETLVKRRKTFAYWAELEQSQWLPRKELEALQFAALKQLLLHAYTNCPYYRQNWDSHGLHPAMLRDPSDIAKWPIIDRECIRTHRAAMRAALPRMRLITKSTGGSSGVPLQFDLDISSHERRTAAWHRGYAWAGAAPGSKQLYLWGGSIAPQSSRSRVKDILYQRLHRRHVISCFDGADDLAGRFATAMERHRPEAVVAYTNPLYDVARKLEQSGRTLSHVPRSIVVGAEKLHDFQRRLIEKVFNSPVYETYGSREFMLIGGECELHCGLHLTTEHLLVEVLDDDGRPATAGTEGNVIITDLYNYGMPFIRYANGDRAVAGLGDCECGRGLPLLKKVVGRQLDVLVGSGGKPIAGEFFPHLMKDFPSVSRFQVVQEQPGRLRISMVTDGMAGRDRMTLERLVRREMGPEVQVEFAQVSQIPLTAAGKRQVVVNRIPAKRAG